jgi:hypothetical protein
MIINEDVLIRLKLIGKLSDQKNKMSGLLGRYPTVQKQFLLSPIIRWWYGDSADTTLVFINNTLTDCQEIVELNSNSAFFDLSSREHKLSFYEHVKSSEIVTSLTDIGSELENALIGVAILKNTYIDNCHVTSKLDIYILKINRLAETIKDHILKFEKNLDRLNNQ